MKIIKLKAIIKKFSVNIVLLCLLTFAISITKAIDTAAQNCATIPNNPFINCGFETGDFTGWVTQDLSEPFFPLMVGGVGLTPGYGLFTSAPTQGVFAALHGSDGNGPGTIRIAQDVFLPQGANTLVFDFRVGWDLLGYGATQERVFDINIEPNGGGTALQTIFIGSMEPGSQALPDLAGNQVGIVDVSAFAGNNVRISFDAFVPEYFTGPAFAQLDNVYVTLSPGTIIIEKDTDPPGGAGFGFTNDIPGGPDVFTLDDGEAQIFTNIPVGTYTVTEDNPTITPGGFLLTDLSCNDMGSSTSIATRTATIDLDPDEIIICRFINTEQLVGLNILKTDSPDPVVAGDQLTYDITISNDSIDETATNVMLNDLLPPGVTIVDVIAPESVECTTTDSESVQCDIGELIPGEFVVITIVVIPGPDLVVDNPVIIENIATLTAEPGSVVREAITLTEVVPVEEVNIDPDEVEKLVEKGETFTAKVDITVPSNGLANLNSVESEIINTLQRVDVQGVVLDVAFSDLFEVDSVETSQGVCTIGSIQCLLGSILEGQVVTVVINFIAPEESGEFDIVYTVTTATGQMFTNTTTITVAEAGTSGCYIASNGTLVGFPTYLLLPIFIIIRRTLKKIIKGELYL